MARAAMTSAGSASRIAGNSKETALWLLERLAVAVNNIGVALQVAGRLRPDVLATSIGILVGRYDALRAVYRETDGELTKEAVASGESSVGIERFTVSSNSLSDAPLSGDQVDKDVAKFLPLELAEIFKYPAGGARRAADLTRR